MKKKHIIPKNGGKETHYHNFVKDFDHEEIKYLIALFEFDENSKIKNNLGFVGYISLIYVPALMIYFNKTFEDVTMMTILTFGLLFVPLFIFLCVHILNIKNIKNINYDTILQYLKRRDIELTHHKGD